MDAEPVTQLLDCPAPAKINLFLHILGRRPDGYHELQTAFRLLDWGDRLSFMLRKDGLVRRSNALPGIDPGSDLTVRAARLLQTLTGCPLGVDIHIDKHIPTGGGLGGGSSDAATTLIALNRLWQLNLTRETLLQHAVQLGADVPVFIFGQNAFAEGIGEQLQSLSLPECWYVVIFPQVHVPTAEIFSAKDLTRDSSPVRIADFVTRNTRNDMQSVVCRLFPEVAAALEWLNERAASRMTGSGACVFAEVGDEQQALEIVRSCPTRWKAWAAKSLKAHPLREWLSD